MADHGLVKVAGDHPGKDHSSDLGHRLDLPNVMHYLLQFLIIQLTHQTARFRLGDFLFDE
ncbi:hypothetical protein N2599_05625 [Rhizobium sullae]|uniref:Uncharacterized protein n=1 Tax=Rhizobium sullae TaxID=50338 RepID=A0ABY5XLM9_RHISU|nr:hypothetical protein [Rhizobium sullae]UWU15483.1 hypothetical protein N2599_05625 [Rhizobium sullae]